MTDHEHDTSAEIARIIRLEMKLDHLKLSEERLEAKVAALEKEQADTRKRINVAETWGRSVLYCTFAVGGVLSQAQVIAAWFKKL